MAKELSPQVIIMDVSMPGMNGIEATHRIVTMNSSVKVIALSMYSDRRFISEMLKAGAAGYLFKECAYAELIKAIRAVNNGQIYISPGITDIVMKDYVSRLRDSDMSVYSILTDREREILQNIAEGKSTREIASELHLSIKTIETHRQRIMDKLNIHGVAELTKYAIREGLTSLYATRYANEW
jgi:DNA-binding NarL/FixJ family response regulator